jgi:hypothetical protein
MRADRVYDAARHALLVLTIVNAAAGTIGAQQGPTRIGDRVPKFDADYFVGEWKFEGLVPDSPLGSGGAITGTQVVKKACAGSTVYEVTLSGVTPDGPFSGTGLLATLDTPGGQYATDYEVARGVALFRAGFIGGDLGGRYTHFWESLPVERGGATIRLRGQSFFASASTYRVKSEIAVAGDAFKSFGTMTYERQGR